jgi:hypothetical protein
MAAITRNTKKRIFAPSKKALSITPNPKRPAIKAMTRKTTAMRNMASSLFKKLCPVSEIPTEPRDYPLNGHDFLTHQKTTNRLCSSPIWGIIL